MRSFTTSIETALQKDVLTDSMIFPKAKISTTRFTLDSIRDEDFGSLMSIFKSERVSKNYMVPELKTPENETKLFATLKGLSLSQDRYVYGIFLDDKLIGLIHDTDIDGDRIEIGYALHPDYFGFGYMTEAFSALIEHLFSVGFNEVVAGAFSDNVASIRVMQKCGMLKQENTEEIQYRGKSHTCIFYSIKKK